MKTTYRLILSLLYFVAGLVILALHAPWWVVVAIVLLADMPIVLLTHIYRKVDPKP